MMRTASKTRSCALGMSLVELLVAIGILGVTMSLIGTAFPAGVMMSIAVSDETTSQTVFQKAMAEIKSRLSSGDIATGPNLVVVPDSKFSDDSRKLATNSPFSWSALVRRMGTAGPMGNLCQVVVVVSRRPTGSPNFIDEGDNNSELPELRSVTCTDANDDERTLEIGAGFNMVANDGYIIDSTTGIAYVIVSRNDNNTVTVFAEPPVISSEREFWVVPGEYESGKFGRRSPSIRVFQAMLYLP